MCSCAKPCGRTPRLIEEVSLPAHCATLWIGPALGAVERACLRSIVRWGHSLTLYCYREPAGVPEGAELRDAAEILPEDQIIHHWSGSVSLFSNHFRYELQRRGLGTWLDCDAYLLRPLESEHPYLLAEFEPGWVSPGVLRLPPESPMLTPLLALFEQRTVPPWLPWRAKVAAYWRLARTGRSGLSHMPWGSAGPLALTHVARQCGLIGLAHPAAAYHPLPWQQADRIRHEPLEALIEPDTVSIHVWNERIKHLKDKPANSGSFLAQLQAEGA
jgi:hypothetical protein